MASERAALRELSIVPDGESHARGATREPADPRDRLEERLEFVVWKEVDVAEILGINPATLAMRVSLLPRRRLEPHSVARERQMRRTNPWVSVFKVVFSVAQAHVRHYC
jgi:hypothetical protein